ncbi:MAG: hypothetical protein JJ863_33900 [Deltaproteobacteria bacterium]|nr:hypothetical protein [Deltaproteobacteria bacterium]
MIPTHRLPAEVRAALLRAIADPGRVLFSRPLPAQDSRFGFVLLAGLSGACLLGCFVWWAIYGAERNKSLQLALLASSAIFTPALIAAIARHKYPPDPLQPSVIVTPSHIIEVLGPELLRRMAPRTPDRKEHYTINGAYQGFRWVFDLPTGELLVLFPNDQVANACEARIGNGDPTELDLAIERAGWEGDEPTRPTRFPASYKWVLAAATVAIPILLMILVG